MASTMLVAAALCVTVAIATMTPDTWEELVDQGWTGTLKATHFWGNFKALTSSASPLSSDPEMLSTARGGSS